MLETAEKANLEPSKRWGDAHCVRFGPFAFDRELVTLWREGEEVELPQRCLDVLGVLLQSPGTTVSRDHLLDVVWRGDFITDTSLTEAVSRLRQALGDDARQPRYIQTIHGRGYKLIAPVEVAAVSPAAESPVAPRADTAAPGTSVSHKVSRWNGAGIALAASMLFGFLSWIGTTGSGMDSAAPHEVAASSGTASSRTAPSAPMTSIEGIDRPRDKGRPLYRLAEVTLGGEPKTQYGFPPLPLEDLSVDPVSGRLAFSMSGDLGTEIWMLQPNRGVLQRIASGGHFSDPVWTRDGRGLALAHIRGESIDLMYGEPGSGRRMEVLLEAPYDQFPESWSGDGRSLVYSEQHPETGFDLWLLRQQDDGRWLPTLLVRTEQHEAFGAISPNGRYVAYVSKGDGGPEVFALDLERPQTPVKVSWSGGHSPFWSATGDRLHYLQGDEVWTLDSERLEGGAPPAAGRSTRVSGVFMAAVSSATDRFVVAVLDGSRRPGRD